MITKNNLLETVNRGALYEYIEIGQMNGQMLNVIQVADRTLDFHVHEESDELFYVIEGSFLLEIEDESIRMSSGDVVIVPKGIKHRPVITTLVKILLIDLCGALNNENSGGSYKK
ncbi:MAG: cupin domain-containing protein [Eubacteriales bacterium]|nr:cupin domain-containing protein [Eubacteriales bacterium]